MQDQFDGRLEEAKRVAQSENILSWVKQIKLLGNIITDILDGCQADIKVKTAKYIDKNNTLCQEFHFAHPQTINSI